MSMTRISALSCAALLALTATASAGPTSIAAPNVVAPTTQIEEAAYRPRYHYGWSHRHYRHYGWHRGWRHHYGWYHHHRWHRYRHYGWGPGAAIAGTALGLLTLGAAAATSDYCDPYYGCG